MRELAVGTFLTLGGTSPQILRDMEVVNQVSCGARRVI